MESKLKAVGVVNVFVSESDANCIVTLANWNGAPPEHGTKLYVEGEENAKNLAYCLGSSHDKCKTCAHGKAWHVINELIDAKRRAIQRHMISIDTTACRLTNMGLHQPTEQI